MSAALFAQDPPTVVDDPVKTISSLMADASQGNEANAGDTDGYGNRDEEYPAVPVSAIADDPDVYPMGLGIETDATGWISLDSEPPSTAPAFLVSSESSSLYAAAMAKLPPKDTGGLRWKPALAQSFNFLMFQHAFRLATDPHARYLLAHKPYFHDWFASLGGYDMSNWGDGDDFVVNYIGHPLEGAVAGRIYLQNDPAASRATLGRSGVYWSSRMKAMAWSAAFSALFEAGPLSEASIGNAGGWTYIPTCGTHSSCAGKPGLKPPTNNTGWVDWVITPVVGTGWVVMEDAIDLYLNDRLAKNHSGLGYKILRGATTPSRTLANLFAGKLPWYRPEASGESMLPGQKKSANGTNAEKRRELKRHEFSLHYVRLSLPDFDPGCNGCRTAHSGLGTTYTFNVTRGFGLEGEVNFFPNGGDANAPTIEGLFGAKMGRRWENWGIYAKIRPGFIYYQNASPTIESRELTKLTRFAADFGGVIERYTSERSSVRFAAGTTVVRYLHDYPDPRTSQLGSSLSPQYYSSQGNFYLTTGYVVRF